MGNLFGKECEGDSKQLTLMKDSDFVKISNQVVERLRKEELKAKGLKKNPPLDESTKEMINRTLDYWRERIGRTKNCQENINRRLEEQYQNTLNELQDEHMTKDEKTRKENQGAAEKKMKTYQGPLIKCYKANKDKSLLCDKEVESFVSALAGV